ncbi:hypothetical protein JXA32_03065, partial [Candidatus Sumerlaeota bacterium]|nr:hypothetical protein [Candidatus Sumerlaeota bacterium]
QGMADVTRIPRALPWADMSCAFGAFKRSIDHARQKLTLNKSIRSKFPAWRGFNSFMNTRSQGTLELQETPINVIWSWIISVDRQGLSAKIT